MRKNSRKKIIVLGLGYIGLPTAALFARNGFLVCGVDIDREKIQKLKKGVLPLEEPGLDVLFAKAKKNMTFSTEIEGGDVYIIAVPTPLDSKKKKSDLSFVRSACLSVASVIKDGDLVILESTVPPGTAVTVCDSILKKNKNGATYYLAHAPERAFPQKTLTEMVHNDRIIGGVTKGAAERAGELYRSFVKKEISLTDITTAELVKVLENSFRDINIAFANEVARVCEGVGVDVWEAIALANKHPRVNILSPGPGVGGHCIAVDPWFLLEGGVHSEFIKLARNINDAAPHRVVNFIMEGMRDTKGARVGILGVAYKKNVGDSRETPAQPIIRELLVNKCEVVLTDPYVKKFEYKLSPLSSVLKTSNCIVLVTDHDVYSEIDFKKYKNIEVVIDTRNFFKNMPKGIKHIRLGAPFPL